MYLISFPQPTVVAGLNDGKPVARFLIKSCDLSDFVSKHGSNSSYLVESVPFVYIVNEA